MSQGFGFSLEVREAAHRLERNAKLLATQCAGFGDWTAFDEWIRARSAADAVDNYDMFDSVARRRHHQLTADVIEAATLILIPSEVQINRMKALATDTAGLNVSQNDRMTAAVKQVRSELGSFPVRASVTV